MSEHIHMAIADLKARRDEMNVAIATLEHIIGLPFDGTPPGTNDVRPPARPIPRPQAGARKPGRVGRAVKVPNVGNMLDADLDANVLNALNDGPLSGSALMKRIKDSYYRISQSLKRLETKKLVHAEGSTVTRKWYLGAKGASRQSSAKEAHS